MIISISSSSSSMSSKKNDLPDRLVLVVGTYDGVICGFDTQKREKSTNESSSVMNLLHQAQDREEQQKEDDYLQMSFAMAVHDASVRCLSISSTSSDDSTSSKRKRKKEEGSQMAVPGMLLTGGYDDTLNIFQLNKYQQAGELKTPSDLGSPTCSSFAPPNVVNPGYAMVGTTSGKLVLYKRRDWSVQHILSGHTTAGVSCLAVHPTGKMALSGGVRDGKLILWDLLRGRLAFVHKIPGTTKCTIQHIVWSFDGTYYAYCTDNGNITVRSTLDNTVVLLDIVLTSRANQLAFIGENNDNILVAAACNDGSLPVFSIVGEEEERNAIMAIEPAESNQERFKCIQHISNYKVVTANSHGICSIIDLQGAANMILQQQSDDDDDDDDAAEIITSVRVGSGARITTMTVWNTPTSNTTTDNEYVEESKENPITNEEDQEDDYDDYEEEEESKPQTKKVKVGPKGNQIEMDADELQKARKLIEQAKKKQSKKKKKKKKKNQSS